MQYQGVPQSSYVMPGDSMGSPSSIGSGAPSTFAPGGNLQAPDPTARGASGGTPSPVPLPRDPDPSAVKPTGEQTSQFGSPSGPPNVSLGAPAELDFQSPIVLADAKDESVGTVVTAAGQTTAGGSFGHDPNYNWFQGQLEYVESDQTWHLTYNDSPETYDQFGGDISLSQDVKLKPQHNGMIVRVSGRFDDGKLDRLGKLVFRVTRIDEVNAR
jgi:hypothetical protein